MENGESHLGLNLHGDVLTRRGYSDRVAVRSRLSLGLLQRLIRAGNRRTSVTELQDEWEGFGGNSADPEPVTVRAEIAALRSILGQLGVTIPRACRNMGWRLEAEEVLAE
jgi:hypothetical protein